MNSDLMKRAIALLLVPAIVLGTQAVLFAQQAERQPPISNYFDAANGTRVEQLVQTALARNADLLAVRQRITEAQGLLRQSGFRTNPSIDASVGNGRILGSAGEREISFGYNHVFELGGKRERRVEVSEIGVKLAQFEVADRERLLKAELRSGYAEALAAVRSLEIVDQQLQLNQETFRVTGARVQQGEAPPLDQSLIQVEVGRLQSDRILFENQLQRAIFALKPLVGINIDEPLRLTGDLRVQPVLASQSEALAKALSERPDLQAARIEEKLRDAETRSTRAEAVPNLIASGRYTHTNSAFDQLGLTTSGATTPLRDADNILTGGISIILPFRNRNQGLIQAAIARTDAARLRRQFVEQVIAQEVRSAYSRYEATQRALIVFDQSVLNRSADNVRIIQAAFNAGELRLFDVINEQRRLTDTQRAYTDVLRQYYIAVVELERAVGAPLQ
jgi:cobalt-zinc-cadmium efflux system outer membrane protein